MKTKFTFRSRAGIAGALLGPGAAAILLALVACQDEIPSAPRTPASAAAAEKGGNGIAVGRIGSGIAVWDVRDANLWNVIGGGAQFVLTGPNNFSKTIIDNVGPEDQDPAAGTLKTM